MNRFPESYILQAGKEHFDEDLSSLFLSLSRTFVLLLFSNFQLWSGWPSLPLDAGLSRVSCSFWSMAIIRHKASRSLKWVCASGLTLWGLCSLHKALSLWKVWEKRRTEPNLPDYLIWRQLRSVNSGLTASEQQLPVQPIRLALEVYAQCMPQTLGCVLLPS